MAQAGVNDGFHVVRRDDAATLEPRTSAQRPLIERERAARAGAHFDPPRELRPLKSPVGVWRRSGRPCTSRSCSDTFTESTSFRASKQHCAGTFPSVRRASPRPRRGRGAGSFARLVARVPTNTCNRNRSICARAADTSPPARWDSASPARGTVRQFVSRPRDGDLTLLHRLQQRAPAPWRARG
jgi:hypothetical protein